MGSTLPALTERQFRDRLFRLAPGCPESGLHALYLHYCELRRWNPRLSLVGPGTAEAVVERHYGESLAALPLLRPDDRVLLDIGTGAGFPGLVLAAARPALAAVLTEPRQRKWAFLKAAVRRSGLSCECLDVRVECPLPRGLPREIDIVTCRALAIPPELLEALGRGSPQTRFLLWSGLEAPRLPAGYLVRREVRLEDSVHRRILEIEAAEPPAPTDPPDRAL